MPVLGLGTNLGDRLANLAAAVRKLGAGREPVLRDICVSPVYVSEALLLPGSPADWNIPYYNIAVHGKTALSPHELLRRVKEFEAEIGRQDRGRWAPREIDIDILAWSSRIVDDCDLKIPHAGLLERSFALLPLLDVLPRFQYPGLAPGWHPSFVNLPAAGDAVRAGKDIQCELRQRLEGLPYRFCRREFPNVELMGVLNITPDSFSGDGSADDAALAVKKALEMAAQGASIIDIGGESTRPRATAISPEAEWQRLEPVLRQLHRHVGQARAFPRLSIDTRHAEVARRSLEFGVSCINDVTGFESDEMIAVAKECEADLVIMHSLSVPVDAGRIIGENEDAVQVVLEWGKKRIERLVDCGISQERIIFDPGIGFGKTAEQSWSLVRNISVFHCLNVGILAGHSRKSFLGSVTDRPAAERDPETAAVSVFLAASGVRYLRVHNIEMNRRILSAYPWA